MKRRRRKCNARWLIRANVSDRTAWYRGKMVARNANTKKGLMGRERIEEEK
jgi:hypothetical protein